MDETLVSKFLIFLSKKSPDVFWIRNVDYSQQIYISPAYETIWQRNPEELYQYPEKWVDYLYPEDFENMQASMSKRNVRILPEMEFHTEYRILRPSGEIRYIKDHSFPIFDKEQIHIGFSGIARDVTDEVIMARNLVKSKDASEVANRSKTEFLANLSHDVKTPLQSINILASSILTDQNSGENNKQDAELILSCQKQLSVFFKNCLDNGNFELSSPELSEEKFSVKELLEEMHNIFSPNALEKKLSLSLEIDDSVNKTVIGCRAILFRIILNLISNALKFTEIGGIQIHASASPNSDENILNLIISIQDTGIGIPTDKQQVIFERLSRLAPAFSKRIEGSGIGLYIVDQYVKRMNGTIQVKSQPGEGSVFTVTVPLKIATAAITTTLLF